MVGVAVPRKHARVVLVLVDVFLQLRSDGVFCAIWIVIIRIRTTATKVKTRAMNENHPISLRERRQYTGNSKTRIIAV